MLLRSRRRKAALLPIFARPPKPLAVAVLALTMIITPSAAAAEDVQGGQPQQGAEAAQGGQPTHDNPLLEPLRASAEVSIAMTGQDFRFRRHQGHQPR